MEEFIVRVRMEHGTPELRAEFLRHASSFAAGQEASVEFVDQPEEIGVGFELFDAVEQQYGFSANMGDRVWNAARRHLFLDGAAELTVGNGAAQRYEEAVRAVNRNSNEPFQLPLSMLVDMASPNSMWYVKGLGKEGKRFLQKLIETVVTHKNEKESE